MINILSYAEVAKHFRVTSDSAVDDSIFVHVKDGVTLRFSSVGNEDRKLYLLDQNEIDKLNTITDYSYVHKSLDSQEPTNQNIVGDNKLGYTKRQIEAADESRR